MTQKHELFNEILGDIISLVRSHKYVPVSSMYDEGSTEEQIFLEGRNKAFLEIMQMLESEYVSEDNVL